MIDCPSKIVPSSEILMKILLQKAQVVANDFTIRPKMANGNAKICIDVCNYTVARVTVGKEIVLSLI